MWRRVCKKGWKTEQKWLSWIKMAISDGSTTKAEHTIRISNIDWILSASTIGDKILNAWVTELVNVQHGFKNSFADILKKCVYIFYFSFAINVYSVPWEPRKILLMNSICLIWKFETSSKASEATIICGKTIRNKYGNRME